MNTADVNARRREFDAIADRLTDYEMSMLIFYVALLLFQERRWIHHAELKDRSPIVL